MHIVAVANLCSYPQTLLGITAVPPANKTRDTRGSLVPSGAPAIVGYSSYVDQAVSLNVEAAPGAAIRPEDQASGMVRPNRQ